VSELIAPDDDASLIAASNLAVLGRQKLLTSWCDAADAWYRAVEFELLRRAERFARLRQGEAEAAAGLGKPLAQVEAEMRAAHDAEIARVRAAGLEEAAKEADACARAREAQEVECRDAGGSIDALIAKRTEAINIAAKIRALKDQQT
jgi:hypothetical protein